MRIKTIIGRTWAIFALCAFAFAVSCRGSAIPVSERGRLYIAFEGNAQDSGSVPKRVSFGEADKETRLPGNSGNLRKEGYAFAGWNTRANRTGITYRAGEYLPKPGAGMTLYAEWSPARYVSPHGDNAADGSLADPWKTLEYALTRVTAPGNSVVLLPGDYSLSEGNHLASGVNLYGSGQDTSVTCTNAEDWQYALYLVSEGSVSGGNQEIAGVRFTGNGATSFGAVFVGAREGVSVRDCEFLDFDDCAVTFDGQPDGKTAEPSVWSRGNRFVGNRVINCSKREEGDWMSGALQIGAQEGMRIHGNRFEENKRGPGSCGYCIKYYANGYNRDLKIHDNELIKAPATNRAGDWNFAIELWNYRGAVDIYDNVIEGSIDVDHATAGIYGYALRIRRNEFGYDRSQQSTGEWANMNAAVYIEFGCAGGIYIENNTMRNLEAAVLFSPRNETVDGVYITGNLVANLGNTDADQWCNAVNFAGSGYTVRNFYFLHNTLFTNIGGAGYGMIFPAERFENVYVENNIFWGFNISPILCDAGSAANFSISHNLFPEGSAGDPQIANPPESLTQTGNVRGDPLFADAPNDLRLKGGSPAIDRGKATGVRRDFDGNPIPEGPAPDIGAFEH